MSTRSHHAAEADAELASAVLTGLVGLIHGVLSLRLFPPIALILFVVPTALVAAGGIRHARSGSRLASAVIVLGAACAVAALALVWASGLLLDIRLMLGIPLLCVALMPYALVVLTLLAWARVTRARRVSPDVATARQ